MYKTVKLYNDQAGWYHAYDKDAIIISKICNYVLYKCLWYKVGSDAIGFPIELLAKVKKNLNQYGVDYIIAGNTIDKCHYTVEHIIGGEFIVQFKNEKGEIEEPKKYIIGKNISNHAAIIPTIVNNKEGIWIQSGNDQLMIVSKKIDIIKYVESKMSIDEYEYKPKYIPFDNYLYAADYYES